MTDGEILDFLSKHSGTVKVFTSTKKGNITDRVMVFINDQKWGSGFCLRDAVCDGFARKQEKVLAL